MKRTAYYFVFLALLGGLLWGVSAHAQLDFTELSRTQQTAGYGAPVEPRLIVANIVKIALAFIGTILFVLDVYAGYTWLTAAGNDEKVAKARSIIYNATIGLIVILSAYGITLAVTNLAQGRNVGTAAVCYGTRGEVGRCIQATSCTNEIASDSCDRGWVCCQ